MARLHVKQITDNPFHITGRNLNRNLFPIPISEVWKIMEDYLFLAHIKYNLKIHSFVLMPNHFHMIATSGKNPIGPIMCEFMSQTSKEMNRLSGKTNQNWGGRHFKCEIGSYHYFLNTYKYVYQNPQRAHLCQNVADWPYSTLNRLLGFDKLLIPLESDEILFSNSVNNDSLNWLNTKIEPKDLLSIKNALVKREFKLARNKNTPNKLEFDLI